MMRRATVVFASDLLIAATSFVLAYMLRLDPPQFREYGGIIAQSVPLVILCAAIAYPTAGLYRALPRYPSLDTLLTVAKAVALTVLVEILVIFLFRRGEGTPRSIFPIQAMLMLIGLGSVRILPRLRHYLPGMLRPSLRASPSVPVLIWGAGNAGEAAVRDMIQRGGSPFNPVGLIDDDPGKAGRTLHGRPVLGTGNDLVKIVERTGAEQILLAIPSVRGGAMRPMVEAAQAAGLPVQTLPALTDLLDGRVTVREFRPLRIEDLLMRAPRDLDPLRVKSFVEGAVVLVTGAGGSIGSEICRQIAELDVARLVLMDRSEGNLYEIDRELRSRFPHAHIVSCLGDVTRLRSFDQLVEEHKPDVVYHTAAYKHVPLVETNACEAVLANLTGIANATRVSDRHGVGTFVFVSTDKAVRPVNVMGATKRVGEIFVQGTADRSPTSFNVVRFGNVLGSSGSVVPLFQEQIRAGGPITVTDPEVDRYFMLTTEAVGLTLLASTLERSGAIFVLDMGEPVPISRLAQDMATAMGLDLGRGDIDIQYVGLRPGEKLHEELVIEPGGPVDGLESITLEGFRPSFKWSFVQARMSRLLEAAGSGDLPTVTRALQELVPEYLPAPASTVDPPLSSRDVSGPPSLPVGVDGGRAPRHSPTPGQLH